MTKLKRLRLFDFSVQNGGEGPPLRRILRPVFVEVFIRDEVSFIIQSDAIVSIVSLIQPGEKSVLTDRKPFPAIFDCDELRRRWLTGDGQGAQRSPHQRGSGLLCHHKSPRTNTIIRHQVAKRSGKTKHHGATVRPPDPAQQLDRCDSPEARAGRYEVNPASSMRLNSALAMVLVNPRSVTSLDRAARGSQRRIRGLPLS